MRAARNAWWKDTYWERGWVPMVEGVLLGAAVASAGAREMAERERERECE